MPRLHRTLPLLLTGALLVAVSGCNGDGSAADRPSVILVVLDTLRADHLGHYGYAKPTSPGLDRLAAESVVFDRCLAASSWTQPSTVSLLSGLYPARHGAHAYAEVDAGVEFLSERLQDEGYATAGFSANPNASPMFRMDQGYDHFYFGGNEQAKDYEDVSVLLDGARQWLAGRSGQPFFLYLHVMNVHGPYVAPAEYRERFLEEPWQPFEFQNDLWTDIVRSGKFERRAEVTDAHLADLRARYDGAIAYTDQKLCEFLDELRGEGVLDRSLLVVTSDHGEEMFERGGFGHGRTLNAEMLNVPLLWRMPGGGTGRRVDGPVSLVDLPASVLDQVGLLGEETAGTYGDGRSFLPLLRGEPWDESRPLLSEVRRDTARVLCLQKWPMKMIHVELDYQGREDVTEVYQLADDPDEHSDLARELEAGPDSRMGRMVEQWLDVARGMRDQLEASGFDSPSIELDEAWREKLGALGYVD